MTIRPALLFLLISCLLIAPAQAASKRTKAEAAPPPIVTTVAAQYAIYGGGFHLIDADLDIGLRPKGYTARLAARTRGTIGDLFPWWNNVSSSGNLQARQFQPLLHISENSWLGDRRSVTLRYDGKGGFVAKQTFPAPAAENREEVRDELTRETQDIMSAALTLLKRVTQGESCNQTIAVYDGRRRFNLKFYEIQFEKLSENRYGIYKGAARRCDMTIERVAGFWKKFQTEWTEDGDAQMRLTFWLAPVVPGGPEIPVRARTYGEFGSVMVHLVGGTVDGKPIADLLSR